MDEDIILNEDRTLVIEVNNYDFTSLEIPYGVKVIGEGAFENCRKLENIIIPNTVEEIQASAFHSCIGLKEIEIPNSVLEIHKDAFVFTKLEYVNIPSSIRKIHDTAFSECHELKEFRVSSKNPVYSSMDGVLYESSSNGDKRLKAYPLKRNKSKFKIPNGVTEICECAFFESESIEKVIFPMSMKTLGQHCLSECLELSEVSITPNIELIRNKAFWGSLIRDLHLYSSNIRIEKEAFGNMFLASIHIKVEDPTNIVIEEDAFDDDIYTNCKLYVPYGTKYIYSHHPFFGKFDSIITED